MQELNVQMQSISNTLLRVAGALMFLSKLKNLSKSVEEIVDEVLKKMEKKKNEFF